MKLNVTDISNETSSSWFRQIFYEKADPRIRDKWLMGNPVQIVCIYLFYIIFIKYILPWLMKDRKPFDTYNAIIVLNFTLFLSSTYFFTEGIKPWFKLFNWRCQPIELLDSVLELRIVNDCYLFLLSKFLYTLESVLLGLRKNYSHMATYLLIHHSTYPLAIWSITNYFPGGHATFAGFTNSFVHMLLFAFELIFVNIYPYSRMYTYRRIVVLVLSIIQFTAIFLHTVQLFFWNDCNFPIGYAYFVCGYVTLIMTLLLVMVIPRL